MQRITKYFETLKQAEKYQFDLYSKYNTVQLASYPNFSERGTYVWYVG